MKLEVTRDVVNDLWPLSQSGDASADSQALIEAYLVDDPSFATELKENDMLNEAMPEIHLSPDAERRLLDDAQKRARLKLMVIGGAIGLAGFITIGALAGVMLVVFLGI